MRLFEILDKMNIADGENKTTHVGVCGDVVSVNQKGHNGTVTMGVPGTVAQDIVLNEDKNYLLLLVIDKAEYEKIKSA